MALWAFRPVAAADDPRWLDHPLWGELVVRAPTAALARLVAADFERSHAADEVLGNESPSGASGVEDDKLYQVRRLGPRAAPELDAEGPDEVVRAARAAVTSGKN
jgi:hypothetical protein